MSPKIYFNGCSQVENSHLALETDDWVEQSWPQLVANGLNAEYRNDAISLGSNNRLLRTTIDGILEYKPDIVVAGITEASRIELPMVNGDRCRINIDNCYSEQGSGTKQFHHTWFKDNHNDWLSFIATLQTVYQLKMLQQVHGFKLFLFNTVAHNWFDSWQLLVSDSFFAKSSHHALKGKQDWLYSQYTLKANLEQTQVQRLVDEIESLNWILPWNYSLYKLTIDNNWDSDRFGHPALSTQLKVAELFLQRINEWEN